MPAPRTESWRRRLATAVALAALALALWPGHSSAAPVSRTCGILPGDGAYSYTKTVGIRCKPAIKISYRVSRRFCRRPGNCEHGPGTSIARIYRGRVNYRGWRCRVKNGWELSVVECDRGRQHIFHKSAA